jgi:molybdopterin molybdotransferase
MVTLEEALKIVAGTAFRLPPAEVSLPDALGCVLAENIYSDMDMPPFDKAAVDGFACRRESLALPLKIVETIPAGVIPQIIIRQGECARIMTGAVMPKGADCVVMVEETRIDENGNMIWQAGKTSDNYVPRAEDIRAGEKVLDAGTVIGAAQTAVLAAVGNFCPKVFRKPVVGILATGDELTEPWNQPLPMQIRNSNAWQTIAQVKQSGAEYIYGGIAPDTPEGLDEKIKFLLEGCDLLVMSGGVSMGEFDHVPQVLDGAGLQVLFKNIAIQPGRPTLFGKIGDKPVFGLPGNPVSSFLQFSLLVLPLIKAMMGQQYKPVYIPANMGVTWFRKKAARRSLLPVKVIKGEAFPLEYHGSAHINAYTEADGFIEIPEGMPEIKKGSRVDVRQV